MVPLSTSLLSGVLGYTDKLMRLDVIVKKKGPDVPPIMVTKRLKKKVIKKAAKSHDFFFF